MRVMQVKGRGATIKDTFIVRPKFDPPVFIQGLIVLRNKHATITGDTAMTPLSRIGRGGNIQKKR